MPLFRCPVSGPVVTSKKPAECRHDRAIKARLARSVTARDMTMSKLLVAVHASTRSHTTVTFVNARDRTT